MADSLHEFVADELWLFVAVFTVGLLALADVAGAHALTDPIGVVGFVVLTPLLLLWGEEIADLLVDSPGEDTNEANEVSDTGERDQVSNAPAETETSRSEAPSNVDPLAALKHQYATGEIDEAEFERRTERLLALEEVDASDADTDVLLDEDDPGRSDGSRFEPSGAGPAQAVDDEEYELESGR